MKVLPGATASSTWWIPPRPRKPGPPRSTSSAGPTRGGASRATLDRLGHHPRRRHGGAGPRRGPVLQGPGHGRLHPARARHRGPPGQGGRRAGPARQGPGRRGPLRPPAPAAACPRCRSGSAWWPARAPRATTTSSVGSRLGDGLRRHAWPRPPSRAGTPRPGWPPPSPQLQAEPLDVIVVVRGGGSKADLAAFDQEPVARAIATSGVPVWTGIGHTGDQSVADEVANRAFITPTECGQELARLARSTFWRRRRGRRARLGPAGPRPGRPPSRPASPARQRAMATGARSQLDRHADRLGHRARTLRGVARGQLDTHGHRLGARARCSWPGRRSVLRPSATDRSAGPSPGRRCPRVGSRSSELRIGQWRRLLGAYDYQRQLERGYSVTRDADGTGGPIGGRRRAGSRPAHPAGRRRAGLDGDRAPSRSTEDRPPTDTHDRRRDA